MIVGLLLGFAVGAAIFGTPWLVTLHQLDQTEREVDDLADRVVELKAASGTCQP